MIRSIKIPKKSENINFAILNNGGVHEKLSVYFFLVFIKFIFFSNLLLHRSGRLPDPHLKIHFCTNIQKP
jgi:hypothetical protein